MSHRCDIQLDNPRGAYRAGETVNGHVYLTLSERALIKAISLEANGYASTAWQQPQKQKKPKKNEPQGQSQNLDFDYRVDYLAKIDYFVGSEASQPQIMEAGTYNYGFHVKLPKNCPGNFEGAHGHIRYTLQVLIHSSADRPLEVLHIRQLQVFPQNSLSQETRSCGAEIHEQTPRLKFWVKPLHLQIQIPRQGYSPGAGISVHVKLHNPEKLPLREVVYSLVQISTYVAQLRNKPKRKETKVERQTIVSSSHELHSLPRGELENFQHLHMLQVPQTSATLSLAGCACLQLDYEVEVLVRTQQEKRFIACRIPVIIGNVTPPCPGKLLMQTTLDASAPEPTPPAETALNMTPNFSSSMNSLASNFREAEFMVATNLNKTNKHYLSGEQLDFRPRYVYYEMDQAQSQEVKSH
ncbi:LOW QUALITY PROTEIN: arrestin domain-containing protein 5 [Drosophila ficusphila]|uniref:LOW QUALITY PROTEIN: arrestin domain-containing protein 5 n=1 Tax=Drosophila ficusphila TaxID=30025 RepID=UPI0007E7D7A6|nr:LOW QUALITY PROTEIN: arrestin domain-containing protein 5 [Drosophila ficusphila]